MNGARDRGRYDWLVELGGAAAPAWAMGFAAFRLAPEFDLQSGRAMAVASAAGFAIAFMAMRAVTPEARRLAIADFAATLIDPPEELLLDIPYEGPIASVEMDSAVADDALLLEDALGDAGPESRVVRLFAPEMIPTAGELQQRIDRHLATVPRPDLVVPDASDALYQALAELRRSLR